MRSSNCAFSCASMTRSSNGSSLPWIWSPVCAGKRYTKAKEGTFARTNVPEAPWYIVEGNDKRRARLNCIDHLLNQIPYESVPHEEITLPDRVFNPDCER